jgi:hypothetical protein
MLMDTMPAWLLEQSWWVGTLEWWSSPDAAASIYDVLGLAAQSRPITHEALHKLSHHVSSQALLSLLDAEMERYLPYERELVRYISMGNLSSAMSNFRNASRLIFLWSI